MKEAISHASIGAHDHLRRSPRRFGGAAGFKEWHHVLVETEEISLLVNLNLTDDMWSPNPPLTEVARLVVMARAPGEGWRGDTERFEPADVAVTAGKIDARFGDNHLAFDGEVYRCRVALGRGDIAARLDLRPVARPRLLTNQRLGAHGLLSWFLVPRLHATGEVTIAGRTWSLTGAPAYHDHNWGHYLWGDDFVWEWAWGSGPVEGGPWSCVFWRLADRRRGRATSSGLLLELPGAAPAAFLDGEVRVEGHGLFRPARGLVLPPVMALLSPGTLCDVPSTIVLTAERGATRASLAFRPEDLAQIVVPNETDDDGTTTLNEIAGRFELSAVVDGRPLAGEGRGVFELLRG